MIKEHQPTIFDSSVKILFSSKEDGSIATGAGKQPTPEEVATRNQLLQANGFDYARTAVLFVTYADDRSYIDISRVTEQNAGTDIIADAIYTTEPNIPMLLPVADCIATVVYDPAVRMLGVLHLGRHASIAGLVGKFATEVKAQTGSDAGNWKVWMGPSLQLQSNLMQYFEPPDKDEWANYVTPAEAGVLVDLPGYNTDALVKQGVYADNIEVSNINTFTDARYFSFRAANEANMPEKLGRMAVVAQMTALVGPAV